MDRSWLERAVALGIAGILGAVLALSIRLPGWVWSPNAPAWVQAVGAILAIAATAMVAGWQARHESRRRDIEARVVARDYAMLMSQNVDVWGTSAQIWANVLRGDNPVGEWALIMNLGDTPDMYAAPAEVLARVGEFRHLGGAGLALQRAVIAWHDLASRQNDAKDLYNRAEGGRDVAPDVERQVLDAFTHYAAAVLTAKMLVKALLRD